MEDNVKLWVIYDRWHSYLPEGSWVFRAQNYNLDCRAMVDLKKAKSASEMGLDYVTERKAQEQRQSAVWLEKKTRLDTVQQRRGSVRLSLEPGLEVMTYLVQREE